LELAHTNGWIAVRLLENINGIEFKTEPAQRFLRMLKIELAAVVNDFYKTITKQYDREWRDVFLKNKEKIITGTNKIKQFIETKKLKETNKYTISEKVLRKKGRGYDGQIIYQPFENEKFINSLWIKQLIFNDTHPKPHFPANVNYQQKINVIIEKMKSFFSDNQIQAFFIVTDAKDNPYVLYNNENILYDFEDDNRRLQTINTLFKSRSKFNYEEKEKLVRKVKDAKNIKGRVLVSFLKGKDDNNHIAKETTAEYKRNEGHSWIDCYNHLNKNVKLDFLSTNTNWLYLIRISELEESGFTTQGLLGFYSDNDLTEEFLPKQLLMLLRKDISKFITKHNKNDEFSELRITQIAERYAYLAGHGRLTLQRLAMTDNDHKKFVPFVRAIEKIQFMLAKKYISTSEFIEKFEPTTITKNIIENNFGVNNFGIKKLSELIYKTKNIEYEINDCNIEVNISDSLSFKYYKEILFCVCFELIWNAKKNIFRFLNCANNLKNKLTITFETENNDLVVSFKSTGTQFNNSISEKINAHQQTKDYDEQEGLFFIYLLIQKVSAENELQVLQDNIRMLTECRSCGNNNKCPVYENEIKITLKTI
jgi:hypothetical protein